MRIGDIVSFDYKEKYSAYGHIITMEGEKVKLEFKNPQTREYDIIEIEKIKLTLIGNLGK